MEKAKMYYERNLRKFDYENGELVLSDHPKIKEGDGHGFAHKWYGPFIIVKKLENGLDYIILRYDSKKKKLQVIHGNRLKKYYGSKLRHVVDESTLPSN